MNTYLTDDLVLTEIDAAFAKYYSWWTCSISRQHLKFGPLAFSWYRWCDRRWRLEATWVCGRRVFVVPKLT